MANISNSTKNTVITGTSYADTIANYAERVTIKSSAGDDSLYSHYGINYVNIDAGAGNDTIYSRGGYYS